MREKISVYLKYTHIPGLYQFAMKKYGYPRYYIRDDELNKYVIYLVANKGDIPRLLNEDGSKTQCSFYEDDLIDATRGKYPMYRIVKEDELVLIL